MQNVARKKAGMSRLRDEHTSARSGHGEDPNHARLLFFLEMLQATPSYLENSMKGFLRISGLSS